MVMEKFVKFVINLFEYLMLILILICGVFIEIRVIFFDIIVKG